MGQTVFPNVSGVVRARRLFVVALAMVGDSWCAQLLGRMELRVRCCFSRCELQAVRATGSSMVRSLVGLLYGVGGGREVGLVGGV